MPNYIKLTIDGNYDKAKEDDFKGANTPLDAHPQDRGTTVVIKTPHSKKEHVVEIHADAEGNIFICLAK